MDMRVVHTEDAPKAIGPYSQAVLAGGQLFCSGQIALDPRTGDLVDGDVRVQTTRALDNLTAVLRAAGCALSDIVKTTVFLVDLSDFAAFNEVYGARLGDHRPARSTVGVAALPRGARVEIECVAVRR